MDAQFLEIVLAKHEKGEKISLTSVQCKNLEENFMSVVTKVTVKGFKGCQKKQEPYEFRFVVKGLQRDERKKAAFLTSEAFRNELFAYREILPNLERFCGVKIGRADCIWADEGAIFLEDLNVDGFENVDKLTGFNDLRKIELILEELAKLHSASIIMKLKNPNAFAKINNLVEELAYNPQKGFAGKQQEDVIPIAIALVKGENGPKIILNELEKLNGRVRETIGGLLKLPSKLRVINHGDLWGNNILFKKQNAAVKLIDFQLMRYASLGADLNYFLWINVDPDFREANLGMILRHYCAQFNKFIQTAGLQGEFRLDYGELVGEVRKFAVFGLVSALWILPVYFRKPEELATEKTAPLDKYIESMSPEYKKRCLLLIRNYVNSL